MSFMAAIPAMKLFSWIPVTHWIINCSPGVTFGASAFAFSRAALAS